MTTKPEDTKVTPTVAPKGVAIELGEDTPPPRGFRFSGAHAGIKRTRSDLGAVLCDTPAAVAGSYTTNPVRAACVDRNSALTPTDGVRGLIVNSGNANAMTGEQGAENNKGMAEDLAVLLDCAPDKVLSASTGMIGVQLNRRLIAKAIPTLLSEASADPMPWAEAIITTDTCTKVAHIEVEIPGSDAPVRLLGVAKGSGMIHPNMATTLAFVCTDAAVGPQQLQRLLDGHIDRTFNAITVDGDTSTNDTVLVMANGASGVSIGSDDAVAAFSEALGKVLHSLAVQVARDGEGATRLFSVAVEGAPDDAGAKALARGICRGSLFKCSIFAGQAEWGRLAAAAGQAARENDVEIDQNKLSIWAQGIQLVKDGMILPDVKVADVERQLRDPEISWKLRVGDGDGHFTAFGCDLSYDYVRINADEALQIEVNPAGTVTRNLTLAAYSPRLKHQLLVDGLAYVRRFVGLRTMIYVHGAATRRLDLIASLAQDVELCLDAGLRPLVVVPDEDIAKTLEDHMQQTGHYMTKVPPDPAKITNFLDRSHLCVLVESEPNPGELVDLCIKLGIQKFIAMGDSQGLQDATGLVSVLSPELLLAGLERGRFESTDSEALSLAKFAAKRGVPALHLIDGRMPHSLVGELFTNQGIGTLITRQSV